MGCHDLFLPGALPNEKMARACYRSFILTWPSGWGREGEGEGKQAIGGRGKGASFGSFRAGSDPGGTGPTGNPNSQRSRPTTPAVRPYIVNVDYF